MVIQRHLGLRPGELLALEQKDVLLDDNMAASSTKHATILLGARVGTKAKREQCALLRAHECPHG